jgi:hypothetical protein
MQMTYESMMTFADSWIAAWNRRDVEAVLEHFAEDAQPRPHSNCIHSRRTADSIDRSQILTAASFENPGRNLN